MNDGEKLYNAPAAGDVREVSKTRGDKMHRQAESLN